MKINQYSTAQELDSELANQISIKLDNEIKKSDKASLLVSGGVTPIHLFEVLSSKKIDWGKVTIGLVDDRFVSPTDKTSNEYLLRNHLLIQEASAATFIPMVYNIENEAENLIQANEAYRLFHERTTVCILGMGNDGHTASLFPNDEASETDLASSAPGLLSTKSPVEPFRRVSCSKALLLNASSIYLMMYSYSKKQVLNEAINRKLPISYFLDPPHCTLEVYYNMQEENKIKITL